MLNETALMSKGILGIVAGLALLALAVIMAAQHRSEAQWREERAALRQQVEQMTLVSAENERLSNLVAQAKEAQVTANEQSQELLKLRAEVIRRSEARQDPNSLSEAKLNSNLADQLRQIPALRSEIGQLTQDINKLRDQLRQAAAASTAAAAPAAAEPVPVQESARTRLANSPRSAADDEQQTLSIRMIPTQSATFAEKLKRSVNAQEGESFQEVFGRFLQVNGIELDRIAGLVFDERTGRVIVRAPPSLLDAIERLTLSLDQGQ
jgi:hypothetical protein